MRFTWDGAHIRMSQTIPRRKFVPLQANPNYSFIITDSDNPARVLEITGWLVTVGGDPEGDFYRELGRRYGNPGTSLCPPTSTTASCRCWFPNSIRREWD